MDGNISEIMAISGPDELRDEAVQPIRESGRWVPAIEKGKQVIAYEMEAVKSRIEDHP